ncbi:MAG: flagellar basal body rod protein [Enterovirga sp.]|jgi:flagellar basal-body rod protein FlgB|nr:flagellar basal body rod protein [Enterovirga sp.]
MGMTDLPLVSMLKTRMHWHQARQKVLAENVAQANTPGFQAKELVEPSRPASGAAVGGALAVDRTSPLHLAAASGGASDVTKTATGGFETRPSGNSVNLEDEMLKVAGNQSDYQLAASLYQKSLSMLRAAAGVRGSA